MSQTNESYQKRFLDRLVSHFSSRSDMIAQMSKLLHLGKDAVYRRLRGDTALTADELMLLARTFHVRVDDQLPATKAAPMLSYLGSQCKINDETEYLRMLVTQTKGFAQLPDVSIDYATPELSILYDLSTPTLRCFKVFMYGVTSWELDKWKGVSFSPKLVAPEIHALSDELADILYGFSGRELWSIGILDVTLRQINYMAQVGRFSDMKLIHTLLDELEEIVGHLEHMAATGKRFKPGSQPHEDSPNFRVYHNEISNTSNVVLIKSPQQSRFLSSMADPHYLMSSDSRVIADLQRWFDNLVENSNSLHYESGKYGQQYFSYLRGQISHYRERAKVDRMVF